MFVGSIISDYIASQLKQSSTATIDSLPQKSVCHCRTPSPGAWPSGNGLSLPVHGATLQVVNPLSDNLVYSSDHRANNSASERLSHNLEFPKERLVFLENLGYGTFGEVSETSFQIDYEGVFS